MTSRRSILALTLALAALPAASAQAAWTAPQSLSGAANEVSVGTLATDPGGRALTTWVPSTYTNGHFTSGGALSATRAPGATLFDTARRAPAFLAGPVLFGATRAVGLGGTVGSWNRCGPKVDLQVRYGRSDGTFALPPTIAAFRATGGNWGPSVDANAAGQVAAAWVQSTSDCKRAIVEVARRRGGGTGAFTAPETLRGRGSAVTPAVAVGQGGDMLVAWGRRTGFGETASEARYRPAGGAWGPLQRLGTSSAPGLILTGVTQNGRAYVVWQRLQYNEDTGMTAALRAAVQPAGSRSFRAATLLEGIHTGNSNVPLRPRLVISANTALLGWTGRVESHWVVRAAQSGSSGAFGAAQTLSDATRDAALADLALLPRGTAAVTWSYLDDEQIQSDVMVSLRPAGASFAAAEQVYVTDAGRQLLRDLPRVTLDPVTAQPTVVWAQNFGPVSNSAAKLDVRLRAATRTAQ